MKAPSYIALTRGEFALNDDKLPDWLISCIKDNDLVQYDLIEEWRKSGGNLIVSAWPYSPSYTKIAECIKETY